MHFAIQKMHVILNLTKTHGIESNSISCHGCLIAHRRNCVHYYYYYYYNNKLRGEYYLRYFGVTLFK